VGEIVDTDENDAIDVAGDGGAEASIDMVFPKRLQLGKGKVSDWRFAVQ